MFMLPILYIGLAFGALAALAIMILRIGALLGDCAQTRALARTGAVTIATGFTAIGAGGIILIGAALPLLRDVPMAGFFATLGFAALCLGLGFTQAIGTLRAVLQDAQSKEAAPAAA